MKDNDFLVVLGWIILIAIFVIAFVIMACELLVNQERVLVQTSSSEAMYVNYKDDIYSLVPVDITPIEKTIENKSE